MHIFAWKLPQRFVVNGCVGSSIVLMEEVVVFVVLSKRPCKGSQNPRRTTTTTTTTTTLALCCQDKKWVLLRALKMPNSEPVPCEDRCEQCHKLWTMAFPWLSWEELVAHTKSASCPLSGAIEIAKKKIQDGSAPDKAAGVFETKKVQVEISKVFHVASEQEIKKKTKVAKLSKVVLERLPYLCLPSETGGEAEKAYVFRHPEHELREVCVKILLEANLDSTSLEKDQSYWAEQPPASMGGHRQCGRRIQWVGECA